jgi:putative transposase
LLLHHRIYISETEPVSVGQDGAAFSRSFAALSEAGQIFASCYFITASAFQKQSLFQSQRMARLFMEVLQHYRQQRKYLLHEFVLMPDHFHLLITPTVTLERALQLIKGGFSYRARKELGFHGEIWQPSYYDRRVRDESEYRAFGEYIRLNPVKKRLVGTAEEYFYSSAQPGFELDPFPQRLKPISIGA